MNSHLKSEEDYPVRNWKLAESAWFCRITDPLGDLSNFALGMPITIGRIEIQSSEHLYQAMRFPHLPDVQLQVLDADAPRTCKAIARQYDSSTRGDWGEIRVEVMHWVLTRKIVANTQRMEKIFELSEDKPIVEFSKRDSFWGASAEWEGAETLEGRNVLGCLLTELRTKFRDDRQLTSTAKPSFTKALLFSKPI